MHIAFSARRIPDIQVDISLPNGREISHDFERRLRILFADATNESQHLQYALLSRDRELEEQRQITLVALPYLIVTGIVLTIFLLVTLINFPLYRSQHVEVGICCAQLGNLHSKLRNLERKVPMGLSFQIIANLSMQSARFDRFLLYYRVLRRFKPNLTVCVIFRQYSP
jgi:hypothetical protein